jgi:DNA-directed RNA polymerase subunit L
MVGFDFIIRNHDYTLGNLLQTWLVQNHIEGNAEPKITFAGMKIPHPLRDEMLLRIGADTEDIARKAIAEACSGCSDMFRQMKLAFMKGLSDAVSSK